MKVRFYHILFVFVVLGCEEYFVPDIETQASNFVFEGLFTDEEGSHIIKISRSQTANEDSLLIAATNFEVYIEGDDGTIFDTREKYSGKYYTRAFQKGIEGRSYRMIAISPEGKTYQSAWEVLASAAPIDSVKGAFYKEEVILQTDMGFYTEIIRGINILSSCDASNYSPYYRYEYDVVYQTIQDYPTTPFNTTYFIARPASSENYDFVSVSNGNLYANKNIVNHVVAFIPETRMKVKITIAEEEYDSEGNAIYEKGDIGLWQSGFIIRIKQYSLSERAYDFWNAVRKQKEASGQIFDPVQSQVLGNVYCLSDSTEQVFGYFGASAVSEIETYFYLHSSDRVSQNQPEYFPDLSRNMYSISVPDFWTYY